MAILMLAGRITQDAEILRDIPRLCAWVNPLLVERIGMKPVGSPRVEEYEHWPGTAPSIVQFVEESGIYIHTYPEDDFLQIIFDSCKDIKDAPNVAAVTIMEAHMALYYYRFDAQYSWQFLAQHGPLDSHLWPDVVRGASRPR